MNRRQWTLLLVAFLCIAATGVVLYQLKTYQKLGKPGIRAVPIPGSVAMQIDFPEKVLDYTSVRLPPDPIVEATLPKDTSYVQRRYTAPDGFWISSTMVLMGTDRTSIHKPEFCLPGQGWQINERSVVNLQINGSPSYPFSVEKWVLSTPYRTPDGRTVPLRGLYVFWFVADNEATVSHWQRQWWLARDLVLKGVLQRWAYVSFFTAFEPGQEKTETALARVEQFVSTAMPQFQLPPRSIAGADARPGVAAETQSRGDAKTE
jgi:hypothetical protein